MKLLHFNRSKRRVVEDANMVVPNLLHAASQQEIWAMP